MSKKAMALKRTRLLIKKLATETLIQKIERLTKQRMSEGQVVPLDQFRSAHKKLHPINVLVIEDDETQRFSLKRILEADGYQARLAADATELSAVLDQGAEVHFIIMDVGLPWINGFELAQMIKEHKDLKSIPLIFLSGKSEPEDLQKARDVGADDYIKKPFDVEFLRARIRELINTEKL